MKIKFDQRLFIDLDFDTKIEKSVPVHAMVSFDAATGYIMTDVPKLEPDYVTIAGARNVITRIFEIPTDTLAFDTLARDAKFTVPLDFSQFPAHVTPADSVTTISVSIQKIAKKSFNDIPVQLIGMFDKKTSELKPNKVSVEITGGDRTLDSIDKGNLELFVEYNRFQIEDVDSLAPTVKLTLPANVNRDMSIKAIQLTPDKVALHEIKEAAPAVADSLDEETEGTLE